MRSVSTTVKFTPNLFNIVFLFSVISGVVMSFIPTYDTKYQLLFLLPIFHGIIVALTSRSLNSGDISWTKLFVLFGYTMRNVITPLFFALGNYKITGNHTMRVNSASDLNKSVALMLYETLIIFVGMSLFYSRMRRTLQSAGDTDDSESDSASGITRVIPEGFTLYSLMVMVIVLIIVFAYIKVPGIRKAYNNIWTTDSVALVKASEGEIHTYVSGSLNRLLYAFFSMFFSLIQILVTAQLVYWIKGHVRNISLGIILSFLITGAAVTLFVSDSTIFSIYLCVILFVFLLDIYRDNKNTIYIIGGSAALLIIIMLIIAKVTFWSGGKQDSETNIFAIMSSLFNAYFPGVFNISNGWHIDAPSKISTFLMDIYKSIPLQSIIPSPSSSLKLADYYNASAGTDYQIIPFITHTYYYFSFLGPLVELLFIWASVKAESRMATTNNYLVYIAYVTITVLFGLGIITYNITNILRVFWKDILPCIILAYCSQIKIKIKY